MNDLTGGQRFKKPLNLKLMFYIQIEADQVLHFAFARFCAHQFYLWLRSKNQKFWLFIQYFGELLDQKIVNIRFWHGKFKL